MFNKTMIALAAAAIVGSVSAALSYEDPEYRLADRYPFLDQSQSAVRNIGGPYVVGRSMVSLNKSTTEDAEWHIGDRYPTLDTSAPSSTAASVLTTRLAIRQAAATTGSEDPEYRIGDRYPFLDRAPAASSRAVSTARLRHAKKNKV